MLVLFFSVLPLLLYSSPCLFLILSFLFIYYSTLVSSYFNFDFFTEFLYLDSFSYFLVYLTFLVLFFSYFYALPFNPSKLVSLSVVVLLVCCFYVFSTSNLFLLYLSYEASLVPIIYIIIKWGSYPERSLASFMLLAYTAVLSFPFIYVLFYIFSFCGTLFFYSSSFTLSFFMTLLAFLTFSVKLPIYGLHFWLPMAHVEAPTFGSMILAGVLLKLGGAGLFRMSSYMDMFALKTTLFSYFLVYLVYSTLVCCIQSDFKRIVAYSSVSHMMCLPLSYVVCSHLSDKAFYLIMFFHGVSSPLLFSIVGTIYSYYGTRQLVALRGLLVVSPLFSLILVFAFLYTMSTPPFPSFIGEVFFFISSYYVTFYSVFFLFFFAFLSMVYNINWLSSIVFSSYSSSSTFSVNYFTFYTTFFPVVLSLPMLVYISYM
uniref:NADH-ubiquinone oxidoreductase chain 4 n=1 Tax=Proales similis TaxID=360698 RepID=A0A7D4X0K8_9BILA|nr:NADH dehydrogenase subunit 4 [Proales similis]